MRFFSRLTKLLVIVFLFLAIFSKTVSVLAEEKFVVYFFYGKYCPHCVKEEKFLEKLEEKYEFLKIRKFEVTENPENSELLKEVARRLETNVRGVPFTVVHEKNFTGYLNDQTTGKEIEAAINYFYEIGCPDPITDLVPDDGFGERGEPCPEAEEEVKGLEINLPFLGQINISSLSLPILTVLIAGVDGFNPCAMWILLFLISLLLGMKNRKRMWFLGGAFILASGIVYFLFLSAWLNLFLFVGFIFWVRILVGIVAVASGGYHLRQFWLNRQGTCKAVGKEKRKKIFARIKKVTQRKKPWFALLGIIGLAFGVNLIELVCSAGLPAVYTQVLSLAELSVLQYYLYLLLYIFVFIFDDLLVFWVAMTTLNAVGVSSKYSRYSSLIGGVVIFILGVLLIFKPELIMFG